MAVNQALIQASKGTGEQFIDYGAVLQPAVKGMMRDLEIADNKMASFVNSLPPGANIEKLPEGMRPEVERYLRDSKNEYAEAAKVASKLSPSDAGYREAVDKMNSIKTGFVNLNKNLEAHLANRVEFIQDKDDLSGSLLDNDNIFLTSVYAGDYEGFKVTGGELEFLDKSTNKYKRNSEFPQYSLTDAVGANKITDLRFNARQTALKYGDIDVAGYQSGVSNLFKGLGAQGVIDMAFDGLDNAAGNFVDTEIRNFKEFKNLSDDQWVVEREKLKTKEGFSNYFIPFQQHVSRLVNAGAIEGKAAYDKRINLDDTPSSTTSGTLSERREQNNLKSFTSQVEDLKGGADGKRRIDLGDEGVLFINKNDEDYTLTREYYEGDAKQSTTTDVTIDQAFRAMSKSGLLAKDELSSVYSLFKNTEDRVDKGGVFAADIMDKDDSDVKSDILAKYSGIKVNKNISGINDAGVEVIEVVADNGARQVVYLQGENSTEKEKELKKLNNFLEKNAEKKVNKDYEDK